MEANVPTSSSALHTAWSGSPDLVVWHAALDVLLDVGLLDDRGLRKEPLPLRVLLRVQVLLSLLPAHDLAVARHLEALGRCLARLELVLARRRRARGAAARTDGRRALAACCNETRRHRPRRLRQARGRRSHAHLPHAGGQTRHAARHHLSLSLSQKWSLSLAPGGARQNKAHRFQ